MAFGVRQRHGQFVALGFPESPRPSGEKRSVSEIWLTHRTGFLGGLIDPQTGNAPPELFTFSDGASIKENSRLRGFVRELDTALSKATMGSNAMTLPQNTRKPHCMLKVVLPSRFRFGRARLS